MPKAKSSNTASKTSFADQFAQLEKIVADLESNQFSLDESVEQFEAGLKLAGELQKTLDSTEQKIITLTKRYQVESIAEDSKNLAE